MRKPRRPFWTLLGAGTAAVALTTGTLLTQGWTNTGIAGAAHAVAEDSAGWDCTTQGNHVCGPGNPQGAPAGRYDAGGVLEPAGYDGSDSGIAQWEYDHGLPIEGYGVDESKVGDRTLPYGWAAPITDYDLAEFSHEVLCQAPTWYGDGDEYLDPETGRYVPSARCTAAAHA